MTLTATQEAGIRRTAAALRRTAGAAGGLHGMPPEAFGITALCDALGESLFFQFGPNAPEPAIKAAAGQLLVRVMTAYVERASGRVTVFP